MIPVFTVVDLNLVLAMLALQVTFYSYWDEATETRTISCQQATFADSLTSVDSPAVIHPDLNL
jgi:hypothetical protein